MADVVEVIVAKQMAEFDRLLLDNPDMKKKVRKALTSVLGKARTRLSKDAKGIIANDPRQAYRAVKRSIWKRVLGGSLSILAKRRAGSTRVRVEKEHTLQPGQRGGNRRTRSARTEQIDSYFGSDRGFILRFVNEGTSQRETRYGNRGSIAARNWFGTTSSFEMQMAVDEFCDLVDLAIKESLDKA